MKKKNFSLKLPKGCRCINPVVCPRCGYVIPPCPHYSECMALAQKVFGNIHQDEKVNVDFKQLQATADTLVKQLQTDDFLELLFAYGGLMFGRKLKEWLKQNYKPLRKRK